MTQWTPEPSQFANFQAPQKSDPLTTTHPLFADRASAKKTDQLKDEKWRRSMPIATVGLLWTAMWIRLILHELRIITKNHLNDGTRPIKAVND